ncbi:hypothetical protein [[Kitasatospora] papulosa]|uniref:hypothetical protein n=1 Tax=[Kitasatospora] papulosa TaxID=1464011 RepID=UPI0036BF186F
MPLHVFASFTSAVAALRAYTLLLSRHTRVNGLACKTGRYSALLAVTMMAAYISGVYTVDPLPHLQDPGRLIHTPMSG